MSGPTQPLIRNYTSCKGSAYNQKFHTVTFDQTSGIPGETTKRTIDSGDDERQGVTRLYTEFTQKAVIVEIL